MKYCKNCRHGGFLLCGIMSKNSKHNKYTDMCNGFKIHTDNTKGDCEYYKRTWWKFWVRKVKR